MRFGASCISYLYNGISVYKNNLWLGQTASYADSITADSFTDDVNNNILFTKKYFVFY